MSAATNMSPLTPPIRSPYATRMACSCLGLAARAPMRNAHERDRRLQLFPLPMGLLARGFDPDNFRLERLAEQGVDQPVHHQRTRFGISDGVAFALENIEQF